MTTSILICVIFSFLLQEVSITKSASTGLFGGFDALTRALSVLQKDNAEIPFTNKSLDLAIFVGYDALQYMKGIGLESQDDWIQHLTIFVSQIQAVFHQSSLKGRLDISVSRLDFHENPLTFETHSGNRDALLDSFCDFQRQVSTEGEYDMALYLTSLDLYTNDTSGTKSTISLGLSPVGGVCQSHDNCVIAEFGTTNQLGKPYPSSGLASTWVAAHEMAHNLGLFHDGPPINTCPTNGFLMSGSRGTRGETSWSVCSAKMFSVVESSCLQYSGKSILTLVRDPGRAKDVHEQCKLFLSDNEAYAFSPSTISDNDICSGTIYCRSRQLLGYFTAGPALEGTVCGTSSVCREGQCVANIMTGIDAVEGGWSEWNSNGCKSSCLDRGMGFEMEWRSCTNPSPRDTLNTCDGVARRGRLCQEAGLCSGISHRTTVQQYVDEMCLKISKLLPDIEGEIGGLQIPHDYGKDWRACAIFCRTRRGMWYTPRIELNHMKQFKKEISSFLPDGSWCHSDELNGNYYCQLNRCVPQFPTKNQELDIKSADDLMSNVNMSDREQLERLREEFTFFKG